MYTAYTTDRERCDGDDHIGIIIIVFFIENPDSRPHTRSVLMIKLGFKVKIGVMSSPKNVTS